VCARTPPCVYALALITRTPRCARHPLMLYEQLRNDWKEGSTFVVEIEVTVREVFPAQRLLIMDDGTALRAEDPHQLDGLREGVKLRILRASRRAEGHPACRPVTDGQ
jgi:hypothetical protein